jgi:hypothetical protein
MESWVKSSSSIKAICKMCWLETFSITQEKETIKPFQSLLLKPHSFDACFSIRFYLYRSYIARCSKERMGKNVLIDLKGLLFVLRLLCLSWNGNKALTWTSIDSWTYNESNCRWIMSLFFHHFFLFMLLLM